MRLFIKIFFILLNYNYYFRESAMIRSRAMRDNACVTRYRRDRKEWRIPGVQVWNDDFFPKKTIRKIKFGRMIKRDLFKVCFIASYIFFPSFGQFVDITPVKIFPFCRELFIEPFFHIFIWTKALFSKCVTHRYKQVIIGRSQVW